ncbi:hypothetical protein [Streptomyces sp. NPDC055607]
MELDELPSGLFGPAPLHNAVVVAWAPGSARFGPDSWRSLPGWVRCTMSYAWGGADAARHRHAGAVLLAPLDVDPEVLEAWVLHQWRRMPYRRIASARPLRPACGDPAAWYFVPGY